MGEDNIIIIQLKTGEIIVTFTEDSEPFDYTNIEELVLKYPALIIPLQQQGGQPGQIGFQKFFPFSEQETGKIKKREILSLSDPIDDFRRAYESWVTQAKAAESGIVLPK